MTRIVCKDFYGLTFKIRIIRDSDKFQDFFYSF